VPASSQAFTSAHLYRIICGLGFVNLGPPFLRLRQPSKVGLAMPVISETCSVVRCCSGWSWAGINVVILDCSYKSEDQLSLARESNVLYVAFSRTGPPRRTPVLQTVAYRDQRCN